MEPRDLIQRSKDILSKHYGDRFAGLVLYGSEARGESRPDSDIDFLVLLKGSFNRLTEIRALVDLLYPLQLDFDRLISARPASIQDYTEERLALYRNAKSEGMEIRNTLVSMKLLMRSTLQIRSSCRFTR